MKVGVLPDRVLMSLMNDRMIAKGTILDFITAFFKDYLATDSMDDLVQLLRKARLDDRLLDFFPPQRRNLTDFDAHFKASQLGSASPYVTFILCCMAIANKSRAVLLDLSYPLSFSFRFLHDLACLTTSSALHDFDVLFWLLRSSQQAMPLKRLGIHVLMLGEAEPKLQ